VNGVRERSTIILGDVRKVSVVVRCDEERRSSRPPAWPIV